MVTISFLYDNMIEIASPELGQKIGLQIPCGTRIIFSEFDAISMVFIFVTHFEAQYENVIAIGHLNISIRKFLRNDKGKTVTKTEND